MRKGRKMRYDGLMLRFFQHYQQLQGRTQRLPKGAISFPLVITLIVFGIPILILLLLASLLFGILMTMTTLALRLCHSIFHRSPSEPEDGRINVRIRK